MNDKTQDVGKQQDGEHGNAEVTITVNGLDEKIHRGAQSGLQIKAAARCPSTFLLKLLPGLEIIANEQKLTIKGGEAFVCHEPVGQAS